MSFRPNTERERKRSVAGFIDDFSRSIRDIFKNIKVFSAFSFVSFFRSLTTTKQSKMRSDRRLCLCFIKNMFNTEKV